MSRLPAFANGPNHQRLAPADIARRIDLVHRRLVGFFIGQHICPRIAGNRVSGFGQQTFRLGAGKADRNKSQIGFYKKFFSGDRLPFLVNTDAFHMAENAVLFDKAKCRRLEFPFRAFSLRG